MINFIPKTFFLSILLILFPIQSSTIIEQDTHDLPYNTQLMMDVREASKTLKIDLNYGKIALYFIPNIGQVDEEALFFTKASKYTIWITNDGLVFDSTKRINKNEKLDSVIPNPYEINNPEDFAYERDVSRLIFFNSNKNIEVIPVNRKEHKVNYFIGNDKSKWRTNIQTSQAVLYKELYKNIDLKIYGIEKQIEYDFIVKPGGEASKIQFGYKNVKNTKIDKEGNLVIETKFGELKHAKPVCYQVIEGKRIEIKAEFKKTRKDTYGFKVKKYNTDYELIIDPLIYSTYIGGSLSDGGRGIAVDASGNAYVTGYTDSTDFPTTPGAYDTSYNGGDYDVFITKINSTGTDLVYSTYLGGSGYDFSSGIAVDGSGNAYVTGYTDSTDFPTTSGVYDTSYNGGDYDMFVTKLNSSGDNLDYSTYLGKSSGVVDWADLSYGIAIDGSRNAYITGYSRKRTYIGGVYVTWWYVLVKKLNSTGTDVLYSWSHSGGDYEEKYGFGISVDGSGYAYVTGYTKSEYFPTTTGAYDTSCGGYHDAFMIKIDPTGSLLYSTFLGGSSLDYGYSIAVDGSGNAYITGYTSSSDFPTTSNAWDTYYNWGDCDIFVTKIAPAGNGTNDLLYSTFLGGGGDYDRGRGIAVDGSGNAYVSGTTDSVNFPTTSGAYDTSLSGSRDAFITKIAPAGNATNDLLYSTYLGGTSTDYGYQIAVDSEGSAYVTGGAWSTDFPTKNPIQASNAGDLDVFISKLSISQIQKDDLLGTWNGQGVYYRNSDTGQWVKLGSPATMIAAGDIDNDVTDDLIGIWPAQGGVWVKYSSSGSWARLSSTADWIGVGDMNGDGRCDLLGTWTGQGVYYKDSQTGSWVLMATPATQITSGDIDGDGTDDLIGIWPAQGGVWVKYSSSDGTWEKLSSTADWIAAGKMRDAGGSGSKVKTLSAPVGGIADGPYTFEKHEDLSSEGPGGWNFVYQAEENLFPQENESMRIMKMLGPGDPGFKCIEQKNLVPQKKPIRKRGKNKKQ